MLQRARIIRNWYFSEPQVLFLRLATKISQSFTVFLIMTYSPSKYTIAIAMLHYASSQLKFMHPFISSILRWLQLSLE